MSNIEPFPGPPTSPRLDTFLGMDQAALEVIPAAVYVCSADGVVVRFNRRATELWGRTPCPGDSEKRFCGSFRLYELDGRPLPHVETPMESVLRTGIAERDKQIVIERPDGSRIIVLVNIEPLRGPSGRIQGAINCLQDITERKRSEQQLRDGEHRQANREQQVLASIIASSDDAIISKDLNGIINSWNAGAQRLFGYTADEIVGKSILTLIPEDHQGEEADILNRIRRGERVEHYETIRRRKDGSHVGISLSISPIKDETGRIVGASKIARDITERKRAEEALRESEQRLELALTAGKMGAWEWNIATGQVIWSPVLEQIHGLAPGTFGGHFEDFKRDIHPDDLDQVLTQIRQSAETGGEYHVVYRTQQPDGTTRWLEASGRALLGLDGKTQKLVGVCMDITERKRAESHRDLLVAELSHRVKNTLATVISIARQSFSKGPSIEEAKRSFDGRILALAQTHGRLADENWSGVSFEVMLLDEFAPYRGEDGRNIMLSGPSITLNPRCALVLGMAFHELTTNAAKHGALSVKSGEVNVSWDVLPDRNLVIRWVESGGPKVAQPERSGFGRLLLERALASDLRGEVKLDFSEDGLRCEIKVPLDGHVAYVNRAIQVAVNGKH